MGETGHDGLAVPGRVVLAREPDFTLGTAIAHPSTRQIELDGRSETIEPRMMQVLVALARADGQVVTRDELVELCWDGRVVGEDSIHRVIWRLRQLARSLGPETFAVETIPRVGFRLDVGEAAAGSGNGANGAGDRTAPRASPRRHSARRLLWAIPALGAVVVLALLLWQWPWHRAAAPGVVVVPAEASPRSDELARDLTAGLGMLSSVDEGRARLLDGSRGADADWVWKVAADEAGAAGAKLMLLNRQREVLWSGAFRQPRGNSVDLGQQLAFTAGKVLECAFETNGEEASRIDRRTAKLYLNGCAGFADMDEDALPVMDGVFSEVTRRAPGFAPGWRKRLLTESTLLDSKDPREWDRARAERVLTGARRLEPAMPEIRVLQAMLLPHDSIAERMRLIDDALRRAPRDPEIIAVHAHYLNKVGRANEAVTEAKRAVQYDPLSPVGRQSLILRLGVAGRVPEALQELRRAEKLWPGSASLRAARYILHLRLADPGDAIRRRDAGEPLPSAGPFQGSFLEARANPTPANIERALRDARALYRTNKMGIAHLAQTLGAFGREDELFGILLHWDRPDLADWVLDVLFRPPLRNFWREPRFMRVAARLGLVEYWRSSGRWPDFCFAADMPYDCRREAAKVAATG